MTYVVTDSCIGCKHTDCVQVCPVDCFREGSNFLVIAPGECVDCGLCEIECPVDAIVSESALGADRRHFVELNAELSRVWPRIAERKPPLPEADRYAGMPGKLPLLVR